MRPLTEEEKSWLNQFYSETVHADYYNHPELNSLNKKKKLILECKKCKKLENDLRKENDKKKKKEIRKQINQLKKENKEKNLSEIEKLESEIEEVKNKVMLTYDKKNEIYKENRLRNRDLYVKSEILGKLINVSNEEYDMFVSKKLEGIDAEFMIIDYKDFEDE